MCIRDSIQCDASNFAYGGQLYQLDEEGKIGVIAFTSKTFKGAERNYYTTENDGVEAGRKLQREDDPYRRIKVSPGTITKTAD